MGGRSLPQRHRDLGGRSGVSRSSPSGFPWSNRDHVLCEVRQCPDTAYVEGGRQHAAACVCGNEGTHSPARSLGGGGAFRLEERFRRARTRRPCSLASQCFRETTRAWRVAACSNEGRL